jgi:hypothetical protein
MVSGGWQCVLVLSWSSGEGGTDASVAVGGGVGVRGEVVGLDVEDVL